MKTRSELPENQKPVTGMRRCELCSHVARMCCQSDKASLCYECDQKVHSANFLVAKHTRTLLCHKCQSPTPWIASGVYLGRAAAVCVDCLDEGPSQPRVLLRNEIGHRENHGIQENLDEHEDGEMDSDESENEDGDAEFQVVPWLSVTTPSVTGSSTGDEFSSSRISFDGFRSATKRERLDASIDLEDDAPFSSERSNSKRGRRLMINSFH